jgi:hypothetical protein
MLNVGGWLENMTLATILDCQSTASSTQSATTLSLIRIAHITLVSGDVLFEPRASLVGARQQER